MVTIPINLEEIPDKMPSVEVGDRIFKVIDIEEKKDKEGRTVHMVSFEVDEPDAEDNGRRIWERFNFYYEIARIKFKAFTRSCGHDGKGQPDTAELIGASCRGLVSSRTFKDTDGVAQETTQISKFLFEE